jgi:uncharacterized protein (TIGR02001 family)
MKLFKVSLCAAVAVASLAAASAASAEVSFNAGVATEYVFRGVKQTVDGGLGDSAEVFGGVDWSGGPNLYAGAWISNTGFNSSNGIETDFYAGWKPKAGAVTFDLGVIYYTYNNSNDGFVTDNLDTLEFKAAASTAMGPATVGAGVYYSSDYISSGDESWYYEANISFPVKENVSLSAAVGHFQADVFDTWTGGSTDSYTTWNVGVTLPITEKVSIDARYVGTDNDATTIWGPFAADNTFVGTIKATF